MTQISETGYGEYLLLADAPIFKRRYTVNGDLILGCTIGCSFCFYKTMIDVTIPYFGTGKLKRLATPEEYAESVAKSRLVSERSLVILGTRSDASMYTNDIPKVLERAEELGLKTKFLALRRAVYDKTVRDQLTNYSKLYYGTTITPKSRETGSPVPDEQQLRGLQNVMDYTDRVSVEVGPVTPNNVDAVKHILESLKDMGWEKAIYRGVTAGSWGIDKQTMLEKLLKLGFLTKEQVKQAMESPEYFYGVKNNLNGILEKAVLNAFEEVGLKPYRFAGQFYAENWKLPVALTRRNKVRYDILEYAKNIDYPNKDLRKQLEYLGYYDYEIITSYEHGVKVFYIKTSLPITEDVLSYLGEVTGLPIIATNYLHSPNKEILKHYLEYDFLGMPERNKKIIMSKIS